MTSEPTTDTHAPREDDEPQDIDAQISAAQERNPEGKPRLDRSDESQDFVDTSVMDFDPDDGVYSGTVVDGSTKIDGPHIGEDGSVDEQEAQEFLEQGKKEAAEQGLLDDLPGGSNGDAAEHGDPAPAANDTADADSADTDTADADSAHTADHQPQPGPGRHRPQPGGGGARDAGLDILDSDH